ncbi:hypothetical protein TVAG_479760 [Trichomonas vaginalis G3]|uniref:Uncharacterized protein n=1 Tax=Trichomonas vaginalis (strain ATCC PRA-98 / G3) TaxID=412133 RepID=A2F8F3_TRIV3|nr:cancer-related nucleoside-triphosphatase family [Trichomonas vaginalis G3]EAX98804.1 hypothetical protein TVAG_479760 [Trichomonas vaginalis G3]KAI5526381.1 cancer-related nucleoside-triphosphatase family [Trichomonas vaginalis G3]|eukprot:XP_001311734.1 hypothetical protein [Trichomonas vaginalis G3]
MLSNWYNLNGPIGSGKTTIFKDIIAHALAKDIPIFGFYQPLLKEKGVRKGYDIVVFGNGKEERFPFVRPRERVREDGMLWKFDQNALSNTKNFFDSMKLPSKRSIIIFDEFGRLESKGKGQWSNYQFLLTKLTSNGIKSSSIISSRNQTLDNLRSSMKSIGFGKETSQINLPASKNHIDTFIKTILEDPMI